MEVRQLRALSRELVRELGLFAPRCCSVALTPVEAHLLIELEQGPQTNNRLAERLRVDKSNTSRPLQRLQQRGLVERLTDSGDARCQPVALTTDGQGWLQDLHQELDQRTAQMMALLDSQEQQALAHGLQLYLRGLRDLQAQQGFSLRRLAAHDDATLARVIRQVSDEYGLSGRAGFSAADPQLDHLSRDYDVPRAAYWVVTDTQGSIVGGGGIAPLQNATADVCELQKMYLLPTARGRGLGRRLLRQALAFARQAGYQHCYLETTAVLGEACALYRQHGFIQQPHALGHTGHCGCEIRMLCALTDRSAPATEGSSTVRHPTAKKPSACCGKD